MSCVVTAQLAQSLKSEGFTFVAMHPGGFLWPFSFYPVDTPAYKTCKANCTAYFELTSVTAADINKQRFGPPAQAPCWGRRLRLDGIKVVLTTEMLILVCLHVSGLVSTNAGDGLIDRAKAAIGDEAASKFHVSALSDLSHSVLLCKPLHMAARAHDAVPTRCHITVVRCVLMQSWSLPIALGATAPGC